TDTQLYTSVEGIVAVEVTKGTPQGEPSFTQILESGKTLAAAGLTGTFTNTNNGQPITGVLSWEGGDTQTVTPGTVYTWIFTPQDGINYETLKGSALVYPATYRIAVTADGAISGAYQFTSVNVGYDVPAGLVVKVQNTGNSPTGTLKLALSDSTGFTLSTQSMESLLAGETSNFLITPAKGLLAGTYTSQVTVMGEGNEIQGSLQISFIVSPIPEEPKEGDSESGGEEAELLVTQETVSIFEGLSQYIKSEVTDQNGNPVNVEQVFGGKSVEIRFTEDQEGAEDTQVALLLDLPQNKVFAFSISLYVQGTDELIQPQNGFTIKLQLPLPENLVNQRDELHVIRVIDGTAQILPHSIVQVNGQYVVEFSTDHFSTYAFVLGTISSGSGSGGSSSNGGNGSGSGTSDSESINNAPIGIAGQGVTSPKTGDVDDTGKNDEGQRSSSPLREEALMTISPISPKADVLPTILWITGFAIAGGIVITGISGGVIILAKKRKKNMK
ncbi:MAG: hypothetical protein LBM69_00305, partial [Lachnospiraceae bacterium]|nr:hypothetical protein [Lachnospiraceae bacterium]